MDSKILQDQDTESVPKRYHIELLGDPGCWYAGELLATYRQCDGDLAAIASSLWLQQEEVSPQLKALNDFYQEPGRETAHVFNSLSNPEKAAQRLDRKRNMDRGVEYLKKVLFDDEFPAKLVDAVITFRNLVEESGRSLKVFYSEQSGLTPILIKAFGEALERIVVNLTMQRNETENNIGAIEGINILINFIDTLLYGQLPSRLKDSHAKLEVAIIYHRLVAQKVSIEQMQVTES